jgi:hypothetical protein
VPTIFALEDFVKRAGPLSKHQLKLVRAWVEADWESHDMDQNMVKLVVRLLDTCERGER